LIVSIQIASKVTARIRGELLENKQGWLQKRRYPGESDTTTFTSAEYFTRLFSNIMYQDGLILVGSFFRGKIYLLYDFSNSEC